MNRRGFFGTVLAALAAAKLAPKSFGTKVEVPIIYAQNTQWRSYGKCDVLDTSRVDVFDTAQFDWSHAVVRRDG